MLSDGRQRSALSGSLVRAPLPPAPLLGPTDATGSRFAVTPAGSRPLALRPSSPEAHGRAGRGAVILAALGMLCIVIAFAAWRALRP